MALLCSFLLVASLMGLAHPDRSSHSAYADALHAAPLIPDGLCGEGSGHGVCQLVIADQPQLFSLMASAGSSRFEITPFAAPSHSLSPRTPPPRHIL